MVNKIFHENNLISVINLIPMLQLPKSFFCVAFHNAGAQVYVLSGLEITCRVIRKWSANSVVLSHCYRTCGMISVIINNEEICQCGNSQLLCSWCEYQWTLAVSEVNTVFGSIHGELRANVQDFGVVFSIHCLPMTLVWECLWSSFGEASFGGQVCPADSVSCWQQRWTNEMDWRVFYWIEGGECKQLI